MPRNYEYKEVDIQDLLLDEENPRFASSILVKESASQIGQDIIVEHLLRYANVSELANRINDVGELHGSEIITCIQKGSKYVVLEGNRRTCACKLLLDRTLIPEQYKNKIKLNSLQSVRKLILQKLWLQFTQIENHYSHI